ncbi:MAG: T9SS type A sorting domain-containing protein, partial [Bacteroidetes bacterium]|nr:T9SS type A sorting domain-containing protein [Bacteroidota bacterium]
HKSTVTAKGSLRDLQLANIWSDSVSINGLPNGSNAALTFPDELLLIRLGQYYFQVETETEDGQDINPTNNTNTIEVVGVSGTGGRNELSFASGFPPSESVSWAGGNPTDGVAVKMVPPGFPAIIDSVRVYIIGDGDLQTPPPVGYTIKIYGLDVNGAPDPNNLLANAPVSAANVLEDAWNSVAISPAINIASGGFAVAWMQQGSGISLGAEQYGPISRRSYEILGGSWAPYRSRETTEFLMGVVTDLPVANQAPANNESHLQIFPNPSNGISTIRYSLPQAGEVEFVVTDLQGRSVLKAMKSTHSAGWNQFELNLENAANGIYFLQMSHRGMKEVVKVVVAR